MKIIKVLTDFEDRQFADGRTFAFCHAITKDLKFAQIKVPTTMPDNPDFDATIATSKLTKDHFVVISQFTTFAQPDSDLISITLTPKSKVSMPVLKLRS